MRVIAGQYRSRPLRSLRGMEIRPTADRLRETLFNVLCAGNTDAIARTTWLDLYAGTGAVGIEALSRGAQMVYFVESSKAAADLIGENLHSLRIESGYNIFRNEVAKALRHFDAEGLSVDFIFLDPPYRMRGEYEKSLIGLSSSRILANSCIVIAEHEKRFDPGGTFGNLHRYRKLEQGDAALSFYRQS